jgi:predicted nucleotide-binding protein (sugar kinase/HSP70/actin superfamily)
MKIGIPRALLYYWYGPAWQAFFRAAGLEPVVSPPTNKAIMTAGLKAAVDEICLPVKVFIGHCLELQKTCDAVLVPRLTSVARKEFTCPKFMGLPDMVRRLLPRTPVIIWESAGGFLPERVWTLPGAGMAFDREFLPPAGVARGNAHGQLLRRIKKPLAAAARAHAVYTGLLRRGYLPGEAMAVFEGMHARGQDRLAGIDPEKQGAGPGRINPEIHEVEPDRVNPDEKGAKLNRIAPDHTAKWDRVVGLVGHPYCLYDSFVNTGILRFLQQEGCRLLTPEMLPEEEIAAALKGLPKAVYWTMGRWALGASRLFRAHERTWTRTRGQAGGAGIDGVTGVDGLIHVAAFACGPEALIGELIKRECSRELPYLQIYLDEHSGEAGLHTRLEAFLDLLDGKGQAGCV